MTDAMTEREMRIDELKTLARAAQKVVRHYPAKTTIHQVAAFALEAALKELKEIK